MLICFRNMFDFRYKDLRWLRFIRQPKLTPSLKLPHKEGLLCFGFQKTALIMSSRIPANRINEKIIQYARQYVFCKECGKPDTKLLKKDNTIKIKCTACGASYPIISKI